MTMIVPFAIVLAVYALRYTVTFNMMQRAILLG